MRTVFVDTNVLVYAADSGQGRKHEVASDVLWRLGRSRLVVSSQVVSEYANVLTHPRKQGLTGAIASGYLRDVWDSLSVINVGEDVVLGALEAVDRWGMPYCDAQIWAAAALNDVPVVLSENFPSGAILGGVRFANPFESGFDIASI
jgi:predicted nucleic acid-binding protein